MKLSLLVLPPLFCATMAFGNDYEAAMRDYLQTEIAAWQSSTVLVDAIRAQNQRNRSISQAQIDALDTAWRAEVGVAERPTITPTISNAASEFLRARVVAANGQITEAFVMDAHGLNVAASDITSDYWQGDEAKFIETFGKGPGSIHFGEVEFDESSQSYQGQVSIVIVDPESGAAIGAMTIGLNAEFL